MVFQERLEPAGLLLVLGFPQKMYASPPAAATTTNTATPNSRPPNPVVGDWVVCEVVDVLTVGVVPNQ